MGGHNLGCKRSYTLGLFLPQEVPEKLQADLGQRALWQDRVDI